MLSQTISAMALALYLAASVCFGATVFLGAASAPTLAKVSSLRAFQFGRPFLWAGIALQFVAIGVWCMTTHRSPFASAYGTQAILAWTTALAFAFLDARFRLPALGAIALPVACTMLFWAAVQARGPIAETPLLTGQMVSLHVLATLASLGLFVVAFGCAALYLLQNHLLKQRITNGMFRRLPPLETLDRVAYHAVAFGLPLLTIGLTLGMVRIFGGGMTKPPVQWLTDPHTLVSLTTWFWYVFYLITRLAAGWRGVRLQYVLVLGLLIALTLYIIPTTTHRFG